MKQLTLSYRRLLPDASDHFDQPIKGSYLADLGALLDGRSLGNSGAVAKQMVFSVARVLRSFANQFEDLITFLETVLHRHPPLLHASDEFSDQYLRSRIAQPHKNALRDLTQINMLELEGKNDQDWIIVPQLNTLPLQACSKDPAKRCRLLQTQSTYLLSYILGFVRFNSTQEFRGTVSWQKSPSECYH